MPVVLPVASLFSKTMVVSPATAVVGSGAYSVVLSFAVNVRVWRRCHGGRTVAASPARAQPTPRRARRGIVGTYQESPPKGGRPGGCSHSRPATRLQRPHPNVAELDQIVVTVVLQPDVAIGELPQIRRRVTRPGRLLSRRVVELVDHHAVADDRVVLPDDLDLVVVPLVLRRRACLGRAGAGRSCRSNRSSAALRSRRRRSGPRVHSRSRPTPATSARRRPCHSCPAGAAPAVSSDPGTGRRPRCWRGSPPARCPGTASSPRSSRRTAWRTTACRARPRICSDPSGWTVNFPDGAIAQFLNDSVVPSNIAS